MKAVLPDIESQFAILVLEESADLIRQTTEYTVQSTGESTYQVIATQPAYHVELALLPDNIVTAVCHCTIYKRAKQCKHALAAILMLRDTKFRKRSTRHARNQQHSMLDDAIAKINAHELKRFLKQYAKSHASFRIELLANTMYLTNKPDYAALLMDITPIDKRGQLKVNRSNLKLLRGTLTVLHKQAQQLVKDKELPNAFRILEATMLHMQRLMMRFPMFQAQLATDYKLALRTLDVLCMQTMAPRLQDAVIKFAFELSEREGHTFYKGFPVVMRLVENFILDEKNRSAALALASKKIVSDTTQQAQWAALLLHWQRMWQRTEGIGDLINRIKPHLPEIALSYNQTQDHEDVLYILPMIQYTSVSSPLLHAVLNAGLRSAKAVGRQDWTQQLQHDLSVLFYDTEAFEQLSNHNPVSAKAVLEQITDTIPAGLNENADRFLLYGWNFIGEKEALHVRLLDIGQVDWFLEYARDLLPTYKDSLVENLAKHIMAVRETYGGLQARQRLTNIISQLKTIDLYSPVIEHVKHMESRKTNEAKESMTIKGFVFDLDGVIVDTAIHHFQAWKKLMLELGIVISEDDDHHTRGASRMESLEYLLTKYGVEISQSEKEALAARKNGYYLEAIASITPTDLLPGAHDFLLEARKAGLRLALGSASKNARGVLDKLGIASDFDAILDGNDAVESKPHPEIFIKATAALGLEPSEVVVFEDAAKGVQAAVAAGNHVVGLGNPMTLRDADIVLPDLQNISPAAIIEQIA
jgi:beta-phosphoglucomutase